MKNLTKSEEAAQLKAWALDKLQGWMPVGTRVYTVLRHKSSSGMSRCIDLFIIQNGEICNISYYASIVTGWKINRTHGGLVLSGGGMDMGHHAVYTLGRILFPGGFIPSEGGADYGRNGSPADELDPAGGYALKHAWL